MPFEKLPKFVQGPGGQSEWRAGPLVYCGKWRRWEVAGWLADPIQGDTLWGQDNAVGITLEGK